MTEQLGWAGKGGNRAWTALRKRIIERANDLCELRLPGCTNRATQVHHSQPWSGKPEDADPSTLVACCAPCNKRAGWTTNHAQADPDPLPWHEPEPDETNNDA